MSAPAIKAHTTAKKEVVPRTGHHSRTQSANIPYSTNSGRSMHTNIGNLEQAAGPQTKLGYLKHPFSNQSNKMTSPSHGGRGAQEYFSSVNPIRKPNDLKLGTSDKFKTNHSDINELEEDEGCDYVEDEENYHEEESGLENLGLYDEEEMSLGNFYTDLEKQPTVNKYSTLSQREERDQATTPLKPTASCSNHTAKASDKVEGTASSNVIMQ